MEIPFDWNALLLVGIPIVLIVLLSRRSPLVGPSHQLSSTSDRLELRSQSGWLTFGNAGQVVFDRQLGAVFKGRSKVCNLGAVVGVEASDWGKESILRLVYMDFDNRERRTTLARDPDRTFETRDTINDWLRKYNH